MRACSTRHRVHCSPAHLALVEEYRDAVYAREALRESEAYMQHEDDDFARDVPPILFKDWLIGHPSRQRDPAEN
jgi:hypothetical protein